MSRKSQAEAYLAEAKSTLNGARILHESDEEVGSAMVVKNAYDAFEQALSAGIAYSEEDIPRSHHAKVQKFFQIYDHDELENSALKWVRQREEARYVDFTGSELSIPEEKFDRSDAAAILMDAEAVIEFVENQGFDG